MIQFMSPEYVRPYVKANKNDEHDAERPAIHFVRSIARRICGWREEDSLTIDRQPENLDQ